MHPGGHRVRFNVEKTFLKYDPDPPAVANAHISTLLQTEGDDVTDALERIIRRTDAELVDEVHWLPGSQAVTAVREGSSVFMLQLFPVSDELEDEDDNGRPALHGISESRERH
jgi:hypothetical protein